MTFDLDHFLILTERGAPQADLLSAIGLIEGSSNDHPGQGTANRRFFFSDSMLELAYVRDAKEAMEGPGSGLRFAERMAEQPADNCASPFGIIIRSTATSADPPFPGWRYFPDYFGGKHFFHVGENSENLLEPLCIYMPFSMSPPDAQPEPVYPFTKVTQLRISVPVTEPSPTLEALENCGRISLELGKPHKMDIIFNAEKDGQSEDLRPALPLAIRW